MLMPASPLKKQIAQRPVLILSNNFALKVSIGINSGEMTSGNIGSASLKRPDYRVIGDSVNMAQRLQLAATESQILINEAAYEKVKQSLNYKLVGEVSLKNMQKPMTVFKVMD
jgi:class 3 adenylate cyclase